MASLQTENSIRAISTWIAAHPNCSRGDIYAGMKLKDEISESTVYRWLDLAIQRKLISRAGNTSNATYQSSDKLRIEIIRQQLAIDHKKRSRVGYNENWLEEYEPNKTSYLKPADIANLHARCKPGSAALSQLNDHEVSMFMCDLSYASSRLEGNEYDYASTIQLAEHHIEKIGGSHLDKVMILNHRDAARFIIDSTKENDPSFGINEHSLRSIHAILSHDLLKDPMMCGALRKNGVQIYQSSYVPISVNDKIKEYFKKIIDKASQIKDPYEQSFFLLVHLPYLQPFEDCNKRTSRVICNIPLLAGGVTPISWMDITNRPRDYTDAIMAVYEHNETLMLSEIFIDSFMRSTERFSIMQRQKSPDPIAAMYRAEVKSCIRARILEGVDSISPNVSTENISDFIEYIDKELGFLEMNPMLGVRYGLTQDVLTAWKAEKSDPDEDGYERMRA